MTDKTREPPRRDAARSKRAILDAALLEFSENGHAGARIDRIAERAGISKPMLYSYFGDKDELYAAALRETYVQIRAGESELDLDNLEPGQAIRALVKFTLSHFRSNPSFIRMLNTENMRGGETIRSINDAGSIQSSLITKLDEILKQGARCGVFRPHVNPVDLYINIASLCYFPLSNAFTLRVSFRCPVDDAWLDDRGADIEEMIIAFLRPQPDGR